MSPSPERSDLPRAEISAGIPDVVPGPRVKGLRFRRLHPTLGEFVLRPLDLATDLWHIHDWVNQEYARYWMMQHTTPAQVAASYRDILEQGEVFVGLHDGEPQFLMESYDAAESPLSQHYPAEAGDRGMHVLVAPPMAPRSGFTWAVFCTVMDFLFSDPSIRRIVVEPDVRNDKIHAINRRAGFRYDRVLELPHKRAHLAFCTRADYERALESEGRLP